MEWSIDSDTYPRIPLCLFGLDQVVVNRTAPALLIGFTMIGVTVVTFLTLRLVLKKLGLSITADRSPDQDA